MNKMNAVMHDVSFMLVGLTVLAGAGCERQSAGAGSLPTDPAVTFKPQEMADALHAVIAADQTYALYTRGHRAG